MNYNEADLKRMLFLEGEISKTLAPYRSNTEAMLAVLALARAAKKLIMLYPPQQRAEAVDVVSLFLSSRVPGDIGSLDKLFVN